jgi:hypothetical protein
MKTALFTGAGASSAIGHPLTSEFLPRVRAGIKDGSLFGELKKDAKSEQEDREELREYLRRLYPGFDRAADCELPLITDVFSLVEYSILNGEALPMGGEHSLR